MWKKIGSCLIVLLALVTVIHGQVTSVVYSRVPSGGDVDDTVWTAAADGSADQQITTGGWPRLSPDGNSIVFKRGSDPDINRKDVWVRNLQTGDETKVFSNNDFVINYSWTADSSEIVFDFQCGIFIMNADGSSMRPLILADCFDDAPALSPLDGMIAFHNAHAGLFLANPDGSDRRQIPNTVPGDYWPAWSPDGQWIAYGHSPDGGLNFLTNYFMIQPDGSGMTQLTFLSDPDRLGPAGVWSADGSVLIAPGNIGGVQGLYAIATDGSGTLTLLATSPGSAIDFAGSVQ
jgi:Tol biopolymer transport system component